MVAGTSRKHTSKLPPLGWRDTRLFEMICGFHCERRHEPWHRSNAGLTAMVFLAGVALLLVCAAVLSIWE